MKRLLFLLFSTALFSQAPTTSRMFPWVSSGFIPFYPPSARVAGVTGTVIIQVETDGVRVVKTTIKSGPPMLAEAVQGFVESWGFYPHKPARFESRFKFALTEVNCTTFDPSDPGEIKLRLPYSAEITIQRFVECDPVIPKPKPKTS